MRSRPESASCARDALHSISVVYTRSTVTPRTAYDPPAPLHSFASGPLCPRAPAPTTPPVPTTPPRPQVTLSAVQYNSTRITCDNSSHSVARDLIVGGSALAVTRSTIAASGLYAEAASALSLAGGSAVRLAHAHLTASAVAISATSGVAVDDASGLGTSALSAGATVTGPGRVHVRRGRLRLSTAANVTAPLLLSAGPTPAAARPRALLQTDVSATDPAAAVCGAGVASTLTVASGGSLSVDASCAYSAETWNVLGTTGTYTTSALAAGGVDVQAGGLLVLAAVTAAANAFSVAGPLTLAGRAEVVVTGVGTGTVTLMKWDAQACADVASQVRLCGDRGLGPAVGYAYPIGGAMACERNPRISRQCNTAFLAQHKEGHRPTRRGHSHLSRRAPGQQFEPPDAGTRGR